MFSSCSEWDNCFIPQNDKTKFYEDVYNDCAKSGGSVSGGGGNYGGENFQPQPQQQQYITSNQLYETSSSTNNYRNISPTNEQSVNFNNNYLQQQQFNQNSCSSSSGSITNVVNNRPNYCAFQNNNLYQNNVNLNPRQQLQQQPPRHHPYRCNDESMFNQTVPQQQQLVYQKPNFVNIQQHHPQQQQLVLCSPPALPPPQHQPPHPSAHQPNYNFQPPPPRMLNNYFNHSSLQPLQASVPRTPSIPCQGNQPWTYAYCYGYGPYSNQQPCQFTQVVDIEDFMNNEKRKERSRDAARCRRSRETEIFTELAQVLPMRKEDVQQLDKASIMRIAIAYLKVRDMLTMFPNIQELMGDLHISSNEDETTPSLTDSNTDSNSSTESSETTEDSLEQLTPLKPVEDDSIESSRLLKQTLDGFLLILSNDGDITYVTDNISDYLGISKIDILGQQIWEYAHQCDHAELKEALNIKRNGLTDKIKDEHLLEEGISTDHRDLFIRLKCTLTSRGRSINIKSASYKVIHITGHLVVNPKGDRVLVAMGRPIPHPSNIEVPLGSTTFLTKHSLDMKFTYVDDKMFNLMGYKPEDLLETSLFNCHHGIDSDSLMITFKNVLTKGQGETCRYRFLGKYGGYCWIVTQATIVYDKLKPQSVVCVNYVISNLEKKHEIYTLQQYEESEKLKLEEIPENNNNQNNNKTEILNEIKPQEEEKTEIIIEQKSLQQEEETSKADLQETKIENLPLNNINNNNQIIQNNSDNKLIIEKVINNPIIINTTTTATIIKQEQQQNPPIIVNNNINNLNQSKLSITTTPTLIPAPPPPSLPLQSSVPVKSVVLPQPPIIPYCPTTTVTHSIFNKNISLTSSKFIDDNKVRPSKTVTSSLILPKVPTTTSTQSILQSLQPLNVAPRAQSVTASVFSPLPAQQKLPSTTTTAAIFAQQSPGASKPTPPTQQDMNKGYLSFAEDATELTMLKEEPDDLTAHLVAPNAVDACMPLDESVGFMGEMLVGFMGPYGGLLPDDINSLDSTTSSTEQNNSNNNHATSTIKSCNTNSPTSSTSSSPSSSSYNNHRQSLSSISPSSSSPTAASATASSLTTATSLTNSNNAPSVALNNTTNSTNIDPFINYRDESNDTNCSQHLLSPSVTSKSPEGSSLPSLCSPNSFSQEDEFSYYTMNVDDMDDLTMRAPYIPMNEQDDLPLLTSDDYMWSSGNAFAPDEFSLHTKDSDNLQAIQLNQSINYQQQQFTQHQQQQQHFSNSLCSSPASTVSSMSPSPIQQQQQQHSSPNIFASDSSELAALLCGSGNGTLSILQDSTSGTTNCTNSLNGGGSSLVGVGNSGGLNNDDLDNHHQLQQHCLQQLQEQLQQQQRQQQQHQQLLSGLNINCKKEKFDSATNTPSLTPNLCDSMEDTFDNVYSKNSTNLDCWNEFLQINTNENNGTTTSTTTTTQQNGMENLRQEDCKQQLHMQLQQQQQQQNIILNAVPLITIQANNTNKQMLLPSQQHQQQQQSNTKLLNKVNTIKLTPITSTATIKIIENKQPLMQQQQNIIKTAYIQTTPTTLSSAAGTGATTIVANNKRHLSGTQMINSALDSKRLKSNIIELQNSNTTTSQLLQQLITTPQQQQQQQQQQPGNLNSKDSKGVLQSRWSSTNENKLLTQQQQQQQQKQQQQQHQQQQHPQQSNSVLKNLLISGCDKSKLPVSEILDDVSRSSMQSPDLCMLPSLTRPIQCMTTPATVLRNYRHNPWIAGPGVLPSPILAANEDSNPPDLTPCDVIDSASDSGIDDISIAAENMSPLKRPHEQHVENGFGMKSVTPTTIGTNIVTTNNGYVNNNLDSNNEMKQINNNGRDTTLVVGTPLTKVNLLQEVMENDDGDDDDGATMCKRKRSISFLDSNNPLMTPFLMDLCNDDYNMNAKEYLQENDIENVLNEWPTDLV